MCGCVLRVYSSKRVCLLFCCFVVLLFCCFVVVVVVFFFQAEDGIRDRDVTGVQTCALPISSLDRWRAVAGSPNFGVNFRGQNNEEVGGQYSGVATCTTGLPLIREFEASEDCIKAVEIGRASCRERV